MMMMVMMDWLKMRIRRSRSTGTEEGEEEEKKQRRKRSRKRAYPWSSPVLTKESVTSPPHRVRSRHSERVYFGDESYGLA